MSGTWDPNRSSEEKAEDFDNMAEELDSLPPSDKSWEECLPPADANRILGKW